VFEPWRGSDEYTWISFELVPFLSLQTSGFVAVPPPSLAAGDAGAPLLQAAKTNTALAASAPTRVSFMHYSS
jgi:hypothetical protein